MLVAAGGCAGTVPPLPPPVQPRPPLTASTPSYFVYHLRKGDTLYSLGRRFGVSWVEIRETNHIDDPEDISEGTPLLIRRTAGVVPPQPPPMEPASSAAERVPVSPRVLNRGRAWSRFWWPTGGRVLTEFGDAVRGFSEPGITIAVAVGTEVYAVADGTVIACLSAGRTPESGWGNVVAVSHAGDVASWYAHLGQVLVEKGDQVRKGQPLGTAGTSGAATEGQLAFRMFMDERPVDPRDYLP